MQENIAGAVKMFKGSREFKSDKHGYVNMAVGVVCLYGYTDVFCITPQWGDCPVMAMHHLGESFLLLPWQSVYTCMSLLRVG